MTQDLFGPYQNLVFFFNQNFEKPRILVPLSKNLTPSSRLHRMMIGIPHISIIVSQKQHI